MRMLITKKHDSLHDFTIATPGAGGRNPRRASRRSPAVCAFANGASGTSPHHSGFSPARPRAQRPANSVAPGQAGPPQQRANSGATTVHKPVRSVSATRNNVKAAGAKKSADGRTRVSTPVKNGKPPQNRKPARGRVAKAVFMNLLKAAFVCLCLALIIGSIAMVQVVKYVVESTADDDVLLNLETYSMPQTGYILVKDPATNQWVEYQKLVSGSVNNIPVSLDKIPDDLKNAVIATEDRDFYNHNGFSLQRTFLAGINEFIGYRERFGASTLDQQLVKNITQEKEVTDEDGNAMAGYQRKLREIFRAVGLNNRYSKQQILEAYLNTMGLSGNIVGVQAAAKEYFYKDVSELTLPECAMIAGITQSPGAYNPYLHPEACLERRNDVLYFMQQTGYITDAQFNEAVDTPLGLYDGPREADQSAVDTGVTSYFTDAVFEAVVNDLVKQGIHNIHTREAAINYYYTGGLRIEATMDMNLQAEMERVFELGYGEGGAFPESEVATVEVETSSGAKVQKDVHPQSAMSVVRYDGSLAGVVGGIGEKKESLGLNRATQSPRSPGSTMKPVAAYPLALDYGLINYGSLVPDSYVQTNPDWPVNYGPTAPTNKLVPVYYALLNSMNTVAAKIGKMVTEEEMFNFASETLEISTLVREGDPSDMGLSPLVLGGMTNGITTAELAAAYTMYGGGGDDGNTYGVHSTLHCYERVLDADGNIIMTPEVVQMQAISPETGYIMNRMLSNVLRMQGGTAYGMALETTDSVGKTGTTSDNKDRWFVGLTPNYVTACWWGYDTGEPLALAAGATTNPPTIAWKMIMDTVQANMEPKEFPPKPEAVVEKAFCRDSGLLQGEHCTNLMTGYYNANDLPAVCDSHSGVPPEDAAAAKAAAQAAADAAAAKADKDDD